jgi:putative protein kinase ArgK-like GTPase of G3E family
VVVRYPLADRAWAVRHVLQYGADAVVLAPASVRAAVEAVLTAALTELETEPEGATPVVGATGTPGAGASPS